MENVCRFFSIKKNHGEESYSLPHISDLLDQLKDVVYFTKLDIRIRYHQLRIVEDDVWKTAFKIKEGLFEWLVIPFGLCNAPVTFMWVMNDVFRPFIDDCFTFYLDSILIFNKTWDDHVKHVKQVPNFMKDKKLYLKMSKCEFGKIYFVHLGYIVGGGNLNISPSKVEVIVNWAKPNSTMEVRSFLGEVQYWKFFITNLSYIASPLHALKSVKHVFQCREKQKINTSIN
jgi:hypothetical protein